MADLVASGRIRIGFDVANSQFVQWNGQEPFAGVHFEIAAAIARDLGVALETSNFGAYKVELDAGLQGRWDIAFCYIVSAPGIAFSNPYCQDEWTYVVLEASPARIPSDVDRAGWRIATYRDSILQRYLGDNLRRAVVVPVGSRLQAADLVRGRDVEAWFDQRTALVRLADTLPGGRILRDPATRALAAVAVADGRADLLKFVNTWIERAKASGIIAELIKRSGLSDGVTVAPPGPA